METIISDDWSMIIGKHSEIKLRLVLHELMCPLNFVEVVLETQNITLSSPKSVLRRMKILAAQCQSSVLRLLTQALQNMLAEETEYKAARRRQTELLEKGFHLGFRKPASRNELQER